MIVYMRAPRPVLGDTEAKRQTTVTQIVANALLHCVVAFYMYSFSFALGGGSLSEPCTHRFPPIPSFQDAKRKGKRLVFLSTAKLGLVSVCSKS